MSVQSKNMLFNHLFCLGLSMVGNSVPGLGITSSPALQGSSHQRVPIASSGQEDRHTLSKGSEQQKRLNLTQGDWYFRLLFLLVLGQAEIPEQASPFGNILILSFYSEIQRGRKGTEKANSLFKPQLKDGFSQRNLSLHLNSSPTITYILML